MIIIEPTKNMKTRINSLIFFPASPIVRLEVSLETGSSDYNPSIRQLRLGSGFRGTLDCFCNFHTLSPECPCTFINMITIIIIDDSNSLSRGRTSNGTDNT